MLETFWTNVQYGINHVLDVKGYDHLLFLMVLAVPYVFKDWKRVLLLITTFTLGHTLSLVLATYNVVSVNGKLVEFLIPVTILINLPVTIISGNTLPSVSAPLLLVRS